MSPDQSGPDRIDQIKKSRVPEITDSMLCNCQNDMWTKSLTLADSKVITVRMP